jgi:hypothetical protein
VLAFAPDDNLLVTLRQQAMEFWRIPEGTLIQAFAAPTNGDYSPHLSMAISPKCDRIVTGNYKHIATPNGTLTEGSTTAIRFPTMLRISLQNGNLATLDWFGGYTRYQVQRSQFDNPGWVNFGDVTTNRSTPLPLEGAGAILRVIGVAP